MKRLSEPPPSVRTVRPNVPEGVDRAIRRALSAVARAMWRDSRSAASTFGIVLTTSGSVSTEKSVGCLLRSSRWPFSTT